MDLNLQDLNRTEFPVPVELEDKHRHHQLEPALQLGAAQLLVADAVWLGLLRHRDDRHRVIEIRLLALWL